MPRVKQFIGGRWKVIGNTYSWELWSPTTRIQILTSKLRYKHKLSARSYPGREYIVESSEFDYRLTEWERALIKEQPLWNVLNKLHKFIRWLKETRKGDWLAREKAELETFHGVLRRLAGETELIAHLHFTENIPAESYVSGCKLCKFPSCPNSPTSSTSSGPESCPSDCSLCDP